MSVGDLLDDWFENDALKGSYASTGVVGVWAGPRTPGTAYNLLHHALGELDGVSGAWGHVRGGMGAISQALAASGQAAGAVVRTGAPVRSIDVVDGRVSGVTLENGEQLHAPVVVSGAHPKTTLLDLVGAEHLPGEVVEDMRRYRSRGGSVKTNWILSEPPRFAGVTEEENHALLRTSLALCPSVDYLERPDGAREAFAQRCLALLAQYAPNVTAAVEHYEVLAPPDLERIFGLVGGSIFQGEQGLDQMAFMRPSPLVARYATPVDGLYLCGAGTHPGGGVIAAAGHNAAHVVLRDQRRARLRERVRHPIATVR